MKKKYLFIAIALLLLPIVGLTYFYYQKNTNFCLGEDEVVEYKIEKDLPPLGSVGEVTIEIKNKLTNAIIKSFIVRPVNTRSAILLELRPCHLYVMREFNYDDKKGILPGFREELWKYDYNGNGEMLIMLGERDLSGKENVPFQFHFHVSPGEKYVTLTRGYSGSADYAVVVKDLATLDDVLVLTQKELVSKYRVPQYEIGAGNWLDDDTFLLFVTDAAVSYVEIVVHREKDGSWKLTVLPVPDEASVVTAWNPDGYWIAYNNGPGWIGVEDIAQDIYAQWRKEGKTQSLFVYNLATKQKITLVSNGDPAWSFKTKWLSNTQLEYTPPSDEKKIYTLPQ